MTTSAKTENGSASEPVPGERAEARHPDLTPSKDRGRGDLRGATSKPVELRQLEVAYRGRGRQVIHALRGISLSVEQGQVVGFLGPNGAGKTTALHALLGFVAPTRGEALLFGKPASQSGARARIGYLPSPPETYRFLTGRELLSMAGRLFGLRGKPLRDRIDALLEQVGLRDAAARRIGGYSRGMVQRIGLAQALINDPDLLILDEPTGGLDPIGRMDVRALLADLKQRGKTVFFSSHELSEVERVCDEVVLLATGRIAARGTVAGLVAPGQSLESFFLETVQNAAREGES